MDKKLKLFVSVPMRGRTEEQIRADMLRAKTSAENFFGPVELIDTLLDGPGDAGPLWYLGQSIVLMDKADIVYFCRGWSDYQGCLIEQQCAEYYDKDVFYEDQTDLMSKKEN